jgi:hypothetical protein
MLKDNVRESVFHNQESFPEPRDVSDFASAGAIIDLFLSQNPDHGRVFVYNSWPGIPDMDKFRKRLREETQRSLEAQGLPRDEVLRKVKERKPTLEEMTPLMRQFSFAAEWLAKYERVEDPSWGSKHTHSRDYVWQLMDLLKTKYSKLWKENRLALIPNGDVFLALDKKLRAGEMPGVENIGFFSRDGGYVHQPDLGVLLEITPERARIANDTIWEVVTRHPHTAFSEKP